MNIKQAVLWSGLAAVSTMTVRAWRRVTPDKSGDKTLQRNIRIHNYVHEVESGIAYADYVNRISPVTRAAYELMGVPFDESKLLHSQMGSLNAEDIIYILSGEVTRYNDPEKYSSEFGTQAFRYELDQGRFIRVGGMLFDELTPGYTSERLSVHACQTQQFCYAFGTEHPVGLVLAENIRHLSKYMKETS